MQPEAQEKDVNSLRYPYWTILADCAVQTLRGCLWVIYILTYSILCNMPRPFLLIESNGS